MQLEISKLADGGYTVVDRSYLAEGSRYAPQPLNFACTTIDEALAYVKRKFEPPAIAVTEGFDGRPGAVNMVDAA